MRVVWIVVPATLMLVACGDPLAGVERLSETAPLPSNEVATALPTQEELDREASVLAGLFRNSDDEPVAVAQEEAPTDTVPTASSVVADETLVLVPQTTTATPEAKPKGVFGWLRRAATNQENIAAQDESAFGGEEQGLDDGALSDENAPDEGVVVASLTLEAPAAQALDDQPPSVARRGLFGRTEATQNAGMDLRDVTPGTLLPFGEVARVCDVHPSAVATQVDRAARKGVGYSLYDSAPDSAAPRTFYVTGFNDHCPRQFTASLAIFGAPAFHEQLRYGLPADEYPYSTTDRAYENVKKEVCKVGRNKPCGPRISRLEKTTIFISVYEHFEENARWADMLLHDGALLAAAVKTP